MDAFFETLIRHKKTPRDFLVEGGLFFGGLAAAFLAIFLGSFLHLRIFGVVGAAVILFFALQAIVFHKWEYEYTMTENTIDIDKIVAQRKRSRMISFDTKDCEVIAPMDSTHFDAYKHLPLKDYTAYPEHPDNYFAVLERNGARICVLFQPTEEMVQAFKRYNPAAVRLHK